MDPFPHLHLFEIAIRRVYPELKIDASLVIDEEYDSLYFSDRKINFFRSSEDFQSIDFKIKRFRNRFHISGNIDKVSPDHIVTRYNVDTALKLGNKRKGIPEIVEKLDELRGNIIRLNEEVGKVKQEIVELKKFSAQGFGLATPTHYSAITDSSNSQITPTQYSDNNESSHNYPPAYPDTQSDYIEMKPRLQM